MNTPSTTPTKSVQVALHPLIYEKLKIKATNSGMSIPTLIKSYILQGLDITDFYKMINQDNSV